LEKTRPAALGGAAGEGVTRAAHDGLGNTVRIESTNAGIWSYRHDDSGRLVEVTKPDGSRISSSYDAAGRLLRRRGPITRSSYRYHANRGGIGKVRRIVTRTRRTRVLEDFAYDDRGRVEERRRRVAIRGSAPAEANLIYRYDDLDRRVETTVEEWPVRDEGSVHVSYDSLGREKGLRTEAGAAVVDASYDSAGRPLRIDYGNGLSDLTFYEERSNADRTSGYLRCSRTTATSLAGSGACAIAALDLESRRFDTYDANGNLLAVRDALYARSDPRREDLAFSYDARGRLATHRAGDGPLETFGFDPLGNLTRNGDLRIEYRDAAHPSRITSVVPASGQARIVSHDANGRRRSDGSRSFLYDDGDRLTDVTEGDRLLAEHGYSDSGERVVTRDPTSRAPSYEMGDGVRFVDGRIERTLVFGGRPVAVESRSLRERSPAVPLRRVYLHSDDQHSVRIVSDDGGRPIEYNRRRPFGASRLRLDGAGRPTTASEVRFGYSGHIEDEEAALVHFGARDYDPSTGSFLTLDPRMQFASPYAYSDGNPFGGRDADGNVFELTAIELITIAAGTAAFVDSIVRTGDLGHSLTAGVFAGFSVYFSGQMSTALARPLTQVAQPWMQMAASVASDGFQAIEAAEAIDDGRYAGGVVAAGMLAASLIGIETASDPGPGATDEENYARHGIIDRGVTNGWRIIEVNGICSTRPGCVSNTLVAARENLRVLFGGETACVGGCNFVSRVTETSLDAGTNVKLRCNSFGSIKCLGALAKGDFSINLTAAEGSKTPRLSVEMSGSPLLKPPVVAGLTYQVNLFDPVVWVGTAWSTPWRSDVVLGSNWWVPAPVLVHHSRMYEKPFHQALSEILQ
jgi:RHS repeat-associated protein